VSIPTCNRSGHVSACSVLTVAFELDVSVCYSAQCRGSNTVHVQIWKIYFRDNIDSAAKITITSLTVDTRDLPACSLVP
jgi:hypothetical protein